MKYLAKLRTYIKSQQWPFWVGGLILGLLNVMLALIYKTWGITGDTASWGLRIISIFGGQPENLEVYFDEVGRNAFLKHPVFNEETILNIGVVIGVLFAVTLAGQFRIKGIKSNKQLVTGFIGGILMGYGARLSLGCNVGAMVGGIASQSIHGWVTGIFIFLGALAGCYLIVHRKEIQ